MTLALLFAKLSLAGKLAVGGSVAFATIGGAGAAGALPGPLQDGYQAAVNVVVDDNAPSLLSANEAAPTEDSTTIPGEPTTVPTAPTETTEPSEPTDTIAPPQTTVEPDDETEPGNGENPDGKGKHGKGEHRSPESISLECSYAERTVHCEWASDALPEGVRYVLLKTGEGHKGRALFPAPGATSFDDTMLRPNRTVHYMVIATNPDERRPIAHSNRVKIKLPGSANDPDDDSDDVDSDDDDDDDDRDDRGNKGKGPRGKPGHRGHGLPPTTNESNDDE